MPDGSLSPTILPPTITPINPAEAYYDLGHFSRPVATSSAAAQRWFDRGLTWSYAFCHYESVKAFEQAILADPSCAMAHWGLAYALGPNYNKPWESFDEEERRESLKRCRAASLRALDLAANPLEKALARALGYRYPEVNDRQYERWTKEYAEAMAEVYKEFSDDLDVAAIYADSRMNIAPWDLWDLKTGLPRESSKTEVIKNVLERALANPRAHSHPGILHFYIHLIEMSPYPERGIPPADRLRGLIPDAGHLNHMPSHLDVLIGDYRRAIASNAEAIIGDEKYVARNGYLDYYAFYRLHNYHFLIYAALFNGQFRIAMEMVEQMEHSLTDEVLRVKSPPLINWLEPFKSVRAHVLVRFGKWDEILSLPFPEDREFYCFTTAIVHYARGIAFALTDRIKEADAERKAYVSAVAKVPPNRHEFPNTCSDILAIGEAMLDGEIEYRKGNLKAGFAHLQTAIDRSDNLIYAEPWGWMQPPRHAYAALKLEQGELEEAARVYAADLGFDGSLPRAHQHPNNVWALHGYFECLSKLGRQAEARIVNQQLKLALAVADVSIESSCFCRRLQPAENSSCCGKL